MYTRGIPATAAAAWPGPSPLRRRPAKQERGDGGSGDGGNGRAARPTQLNPGDVREHAVRERALPASPALPAGAGGGVTGGSARSLPAQPGVGAGLARGCAGVGRGQVIDRRHRRRGAFRPPARPLASSRSRGLLRRPPPLVWPPPAEVPALPRGPAGVGAFCHLNPSGFRARAGALELNLACICDLGLVTSHIPEPR